MDDKRLTKRRQGLRGQAPLRHPVFWAHDGASYQGFICDISLGGCYVSSITIPPAGSEVIISLPYLKTSGELIGIKARVMAQRRKYSGFGLVFSGLNEKQALAVSLAILQSEQISEGRHSGKK
ncbi:PilZ domain-containing protein [candidate division TA06 bacterium]|uniref:PilZ domain-containing protein n=1 Tax=candidate division TA06 bacterium TaxID=2250710 RepID=A0A933I9V3_UNCT6|nr:PilZ domain-containing protein [candidate division TA06 bacterium]